MVAWSRDILTNKNVHDTKLDQAVVLPWLDITRCPGHKNTFLLSIINSCVTSFVDTLELLESEQEKAEGECAIHQNQCNQSGLTRNNYPSPLHRPSLPQKITSGGCINKHLLTLNGKSINEADDDDFLHAIM